MRWLTFNALFSFLIVGRNKVRYIQKKQMLHDDVIAQVKHLANTIPLEDTIRAFLYSLSTGANEYRTALASLLYANALPLNHWRGKPDNGLTIIIIR